jgi:hypothetical protein
MVLKVLTHAQLTNNQVDTHWRVIGPTPFCNGPTCVVRPRIFLIQSAKALRLGLGIARQTDH